MRITGETAFVLHARPWRETSLLVEALTLEHLKSKVARYGAIRVWGSIGFVITVLALGEMLDRTGLRAVLWLPAG